MPRKTEDSWTSFLALKISFPAPSLDDMDSQVAQLALWECAANGLFYLESLVNKQFLVSTPPGVCWQEPGQFAFLKRQNDICL
jgi:hypothetical protein